VAGVANQCWAFMEFNDPDAKGASQLLLSASDGLYRIVGERAVPIVESLNRSFGAFVTVQSRIDPHRVWVGLADGLASVRWTGGRWVNEGRVGNLTDQVRSLYQAKDGAVWVGTQSSGLIILRGADAAGARPAAPEVKRYGAAQGLAAGGASVIAVADKLYVSVTGSITVLDPATNSFVPDRTFDVVERDPDSNIVFFTEGPNGRVFITSGRDAAVVTPQPDGSYAVDKQLFSRFAQDSNGAFYPEKDGVLWFGSRGFLARFDTNRFVRSSPRFSALVRRVTVNQTEQVAPTVADGAEPPAMPATCHS